MAEYLIIVALVAVAAIAVVAKTSGTIKQGFAKIAAGLRGEEIQPDYPSIGATDTKVSDLGDFNQGVNNDD